MLTYSKQIDCWLLSGSVLRCGDLLEVALDDGGWIPCRFELGWGPRGSYPLVHIPFHKADVPLVAHALTLRRAR